MRSASWPALGTTAQVVVSDESALPEAVQLLQGHLQALDEACSRFRPDSELRRLRPGRQPVGTVLTKAVAAAVEAAEQTDGLVDPTLGRALVAAGYDRTFAQLPPDGPVAVRLPSQGDWRQIRCDDGVLELPPGVLLDLGATAKAWAADRAADAIARALGIAVLVDLGGDLAVAGMPPPGGWSIDAAGEVISIRSGGLATSSTRLRTWTRGGARQHHVLDPRTGAPARTPWSTVTVAAATCLEANTASTAAVVLGRAAADWLAERELPARLVSADGTVVRLCGWPEEEAA